jgi:phosphomannomutase/phosphoglucomutase
MLFGTSGIRGDAEKFLTEQFCFDIGRSYSKFLANHKRSGSIAIGMDPRISSQRIKDDISRGIFYENRKVLDEGFAPSPAMNYILIADNTIAGSIMITGSHIRPDFNGIKFFIGYREILKEEEREIEKIYGDMKGTVPCEDIGGVTFSSNRAIDLYQKMLLDLAEYYPSWKVVLDLGNGCQSKVMPGLFDALGIDTISINNDLTPEKFIARDTETEDAVKDLQEKVRDVGADIGIAFDGDGDRVVFVDEEGRFITGDYSCSLIAKYSDTPVVITPVNTSQVVEYIGKRVIRTKVGSSYVVQAMEENGAKFGFEANGGGISEEVMLSRDAGSTMIKMLNILSRNDMSLKEVVDTLPRFFLYRAKVECPMSLYPAILDAVKNKHWDGDVRMEDIDGLKIWVGENTWILFRPSSNAPEFRVFVESKFEEENTRFGEESMDFVINTKRQLTM